MLFPTLQFNVTGSFLATIMSRGCSRMAGGLVDKTWVQAREVINIVAVMSMWTGVQVKQRMTRWWQHAFKLIRTEPATVCQEESLKRWFDLNKFILVQIKENRDLKCSFSFNWKFKPNNLMIHWLRSNLPALDIRIKDHPKSEMFLWTLPASSLTEWRQTDTKTIQV